MKRIIHITMAALVAALMLTVPAPSASALPAGCYSTDAFGPSGASMQHVFQCLNGGRNMQVVTYHDPNLAAPPLAGPAADPGGPSCEWAVHYFAKWCYSQLNPYLICDQFFYNSNLQLNGQHCANPYYDDSQSMSDLWYQVYALTKNHVFRRCTIGALTGGTGKWAGTVVEGGSAGPLGIMVVAGVGCVGGVISYYWT